MIVVDANLIVYAVTRSEHTAAAREVIHAATGISVPRLWRWECANALAVLARSGYLDDRQSTRAYENALGVFIPHEEEVDPAEMLRIARAANLSAYHAEYVALLLSQAASQMERA